ncbi:MAG: 50S ribosomal protein L10 [Bdellovibrionaceae bacterium]|nr:50S ribosomal protein L10 [Pseudobdellovibrionaceae bacterium]
MINTRAEKNEEIASLSEKFARSKAAFLVDYKGMNVEQVTLLRKKLTTLKSEMKVVRNTLAIRALKDHPKAEEAVANDFVGTNAVVFAYEDASASAKALDEFSKDVEALKLKTGVMDGERLDTAKIKMLANLPSKEALRGQLLGLFNMPATQFVRVLNAAPSSFLNVMNAYKDKQEQK